VAAAAMGVVLLARSRLASNVASHSRMSSVAKKGLPGALVVLLEDLC
jgi:hypothetical protein